MLCLLLRSSYWKITILLFAFFEPQSADGDGGKSGQQNDATEDTGASSNIANGDLQRDEKEDNKEDEKEDTKKDKQEDKKEDKKEDRETTIVSAVSA